MTCIGEKLESLTENYKDQNDDEIELLSYLVQKYNDDQTEKYLLNLNQLNLLLTCFLKTISVKKNWLKELKYHLN